MRTTTLETLASLLDKKEVEPTSTACNVHGETEWGGHIGCGECGNLFETRTPSAFNRLAPRVCPCGHRLLPDNGLPFSAKVCCSLYWTKAITAWQANNDKNKFS